MSGIHCAIAGATYAAAARTAITVTANGNAQVDTAQSKLGGASALFDGTGDYLLIDSTNSSSLNFGTNNFTLEFFARATVRDQFHTVIANNKSSWTAGSVTILGGSGSTSTTALRLAANSFNSGGAGIVYDNQAMTTGVWYHYAITRSGNDFTMYRDGTSVSTGTFSGSINLGEDGTRIGYTRWDGDVSTWDGHIDEIRVSNSVRYTTTFTPTTAAFVNDADTLLLIHADGTDASTTFTDDTSHDLNFTAPTAAFSSDANTVVLYHLDNALTDSSSNAYTLNTSGGYSSSVVKFGTYSGNLSDSTSDFFAHTTDRYFAPYNGTIRTNLTWECWVYYTSWSGASFNHASQNNPHPTLMCAGDQAGNRQSLKFGFSGSEGPYAQGLLCAVAGDNTNGNIDTFTIKGTTSFNLNTWYHVALTFNASTGAVKGYVDGVLQFSGTKTDLGYTLGTHLTLGAMQSNNSACYVDEVRISRTLRYGT
jgi:hypothetical protein